jgi:hypothetical protein
MAKAPDAASDKIMTPGEMKPLLALSKREPIQAAIGLSGDNEGIILLDKRLKPKKVLAKLKAEAQKAKIQLQPSTLRFGKAEVDTDYDPGMVRFFLNKEPPGNMRIRLLEVVKKIPYQKVELNVDTSFEDEPEDEVEGQETQPPQTTTTTATPAAPPPPPAPPGQPAFDIKTLVNTLGQLMLAIPKVADGNEDLRKSFVALATAAQASLKTAQGGQTPENLAKAGQDVTALQRALATAMEQAKLHAQAEGGAGPVVYAKSRLAWLAARKKLESDIDTLRQSIASTFKDDPNLPQLETSYRTRVAPVLAELDASLADKLDEAMNATDAKQRADLVGEAKKILDRYQKFITSEPLIKDLDENPFVPLSIRATVGGTIATLAKAVH